MFSSIECIAFKTQKGLTIIVFLRSSGCKVPTCPFFCFLLWGGLSWSTPDHWASIAFTAMVGPWIFHKFVSHSAAFIWLRYLEYLPQWINVFQNVQPTQTFFRLYYECRRVNVSLRLDRGYLLLSIPRECSFLVEKNAMTRSIAAHPIPEAVMICSSNNSTSDRAVAIEALTWLYFQ